MSPRTSCVPVYHAGLPSTLISSAIMPSPPMRVLIQYVSPCSPAQAPLGSLSFAGGGMNLQPHWPRSHIIYVVVT